MAVDYAWWLMSWDIPSLIYVHMQEPRRSFALALVVYAVGLIKQLLVERFKVSR